MLNIGGGCMTNFFRKLEPPKSEYNLAVYEGTHAYYTVLHVTACLLYCTPRHSFRSVYCTTSLQKKFSRARTKCESIVTNVYAPWALEELKNDLKYVNSVTVSCDTSNHKHVKLPPVSVRYFHAYDLETPVKNKLLTFVEISEDIADMLSMQVMKAISNYDLETKVVSLSADNINTNFGGFFRRGKENVLTKIWSQLNRNITVGFDVLTAVLIKSTIFWDIDP
jgi:hypothetical protein